MDQHQIKMRHPLLDEKGRLIEAGLRQRAPDGLRQICHKSGKAENQGMGLLSNRL